MQNTFTGTCLALGGLKSITGFRTEQSEHRRALLSSEQEGQGNTPGKYLSLTYALLLLYSSDHPLQHMNYRTQR